MFMEETAVSVWRTERLFLMRLSKGIAGILLVFALCSSQVVPKVVGEVIGELVFSSIENGKTASYGREKEKIYADTDGKRMLEEVFLPDFPVRDQLLTDISITDKPGLLQELSEEKGREPFLPEIHKQEETVSEEEIPVQTEKEPLFSDGKGTGIPREPSGLSDVLQDPLEFTGVWHPVEQIIPGAENEIKQDNLRPGNPIETNPSALDDPIEPNEPEVPIEPIEPEIPVEPIEPEVPVEPIEPEIPIEPVEPETPGVGENSCFLLDETGMLLSFRPEYAVIERGCLFLPDDCTGIRRGVFSGCGAGIRELYIPAAATWIEEGSLMGLSELEWIEVEGGNAAYITEDGVLFDCTRSLLLAFPNGRTETYLVPSGVVRIAGSAFEDTCLSRIDVRDCNVIQFGETVFGSSNGNGIQIRVPLGTGDVYAEILAGYGLEIIE